MNDKSKRYWFPAKRYGWGWGFPCAWQGWAVLIAFIALASVLPKLIDPGDSMPGYVAAMTVAAVILIGICYVKGEPPKWRWGKDENKDKPNKSSD